MRKIIMISAILATNFIVMSNAEAYSKEPSPTYNTDMQYNLLEQAFIIELHPKINDKFNNLRILHKDVNQLIHQTHKETIDVLITGLHITGSMINKINQYREKSGFDPI